MKDLLNGKGLNENTYSFKAKEDDINKFGKVIKFFAILDFIISFLSVIGLLGARGKESIITFLVSAGFFLLLGLGMWFIGQGITQLERWSYKFGILLSILMLPGIPIGTILGIWGLSILLNKESFILFSNPD